MRNFWSLCLAGSLAVAGLGLEAAFCPDPALADSDLWTMQGNGWRPVQVRLPVDVADPVFAMVSAMVDSNVFGHVDAAFVDSVVTSVGDTPLPYKLVERVERRPGGPGCDAIIDVKFQRRFEVPVPYSILGYNPGSMAASPHLSILEWSLGTQRIPVRTSRGNQVWEISDVHLYGIHQGRVDIDVDWFVDKLFGKKLDDVSVTGFVLLRRNQHRYAVAFGYTAGGKGRSGVFDLVADEVIFPAPTEFLQIGREMRARMERRSAARLAVTTGVVTEQ